MSTSSEKLHDLIMREQEYNRYVDLQLLHMEKVFTLSDYGNPAKRKALDLWINRRCVKKWNQLCSERPLTCCPKTGQIIKKNPTKLSNAQIQREHQNLPPNSAK